VCYFYYDGVDWRKISGNCPIGQHCEVPQGSGYPSELRTTSCVPD
jgi:hypothetical protein